MKSYKLFIGLRLSLCLISIVTWLLSWKVDCAFSLLSPSGVSLCRRRSCREGAANTLVIPPYSKEHHHHHHHRRPTSQYSPIFTEFPSFVGKTGLLVAPDDKSTDELVQQHEVDDNIAEYLSNVTTGFHAIERTNGKSGCVIEVIEPETNCTVRIIGVFHGSQSSSKDVMQCISSSTAIIVLELCSDRYRDLILKKSPESLQNKRPSERDSDESIYSDEEDVSEVGAAATISTTVHNPSRSWFELYIRVVGDTITQQGWRTGIVVAIFGLVNGFQEQILQLKPGLEFVTASEISSNFSIPIILADQDVAVTLQRIGQIPHITYDLWYNFIRTQSWGTTFGPLAYAISVAIFGGWMDMDDNQNPRLLTLPQFLTRSSDAMQDLLSFLGLPVLMIQALNTMLSMQDSHLAINTVVVDLNIRHDDVLITTSINIIVILLFYLCVALPATQVILIERDDVLTAGIRAACRLANGKNKSGRRNEQNALNLDLATGTGSESEEYADAHQDAEIVVVLGLLHVNGVALRLSQRFD